MKVVTLPVGYLSTNCYLLIKDKDCLVVDPGGSSARIIDFIDKNNLTVKAILITHDHPDHIGALDDLLNFCKVNVYQKNNLKEGLKTIDNFTFEVIFTPGHAPDCVTYYFKDDKLMMTGDFLFKESIGRYDFENSSFAEMKASLHKILPYDDDIDLCPGHGERSTLGYEKKHNPYLKAY